MACRVGIDYLLRLVACELHELSVACYIGYLQVEGYSALLRSFKVAGSTELEVGFGDAESVVRLTHDVDAFACLRREFVVGHEDAVALVGTTAHASTQLMQLRKSEALCVENHHYRGVRHIHTHLYHCRCHENLCLAAHEFLHLGILFLRLHLAVHLAETVFWERLYKRFKTVLKVFQIHFLAFADQGEHYIHLPSLVYLLAYALVQTRELVVVFVYRVYGFASRRQFVDDTHIEVAVDSHCQCAWNGCRRHNKDVRRVAALGP